MNFSLARRVCAEFLGRCFLVTAVVGSGIMGERLSGGNMALPLLANSIATGAALITLILIFGAVSGAHFNPLVTLANASWGRFRWPRCSSLLPCATGRRNFRNRQFAFHVWLAGNHVVASHPKRSRSILREDRCHFRADRSGFSVFKAPAGRYSAGSRNVYRRGLLVYLVHVVRESRSHRGALYHRHILGNPAL
jgi:hypothetical protein